MWKEVEGCGRMWKDREGCGMFSLQLHQKHFQVSERSARGSRTASLSSVTLKPNLTPISHGHTRASCPPLKQGASPAPGAMLKIERSQSESCH